MSDRTQASIGVAAPPAAVLDVIADVAAYPEWANGITEAEVLEADGEGRPMRARFKLDAGPVRDDYEIAYIWNERSVTWSLVRADVLTAMDGVYTVEPDAAGTGSDVGYELTVDLKMPMLGLIKRKAERAVVDTALKDLRRRVEG
jgi:ribosome-associated toxin RatA of RatAB toxin-antitoxin module